MTTGYLPIAPLPPGARSLIPNPAITKRVKVAGGACVPCSRRKVKCDGERPACGKCVELKLDCAYPLKPGETRLQGARRTIDQLEERLDSFQSLFEKLRSGSEDTKANILARVVANEQPCDILLALQDSGSLVYGRDSDEESGYLSRSATAQSVTTPERETDESCSNFSGSDEAEADSHLAKTQDSKKHWPSQANLRPKSKRKFGNAPISKRVQSGETSQPQRYYNLSLISRDGSLMSNLFFSFRDGARDMLADGIPVTQIFGVADQYDVELLFRKRKLVDPYDADSWACELLKTIDNQDIFVILAHVALYSSYMRWSILPTAANYASMPHMIRPTQSQCRVLHDIRIDLSPHPATRDALVRRHYDCQHPEFWSNDDTSIGWLHGLKAAVEINNITGRRVLTNAFVAHATDPSNWILGESSRHRFSDMYQAVSRMEND